MAAKKTTDTKPAKTATTDTKPAKTADPPAPEAEWQPGDGLEYVAGAPTAAGVPRRDLTSGDLQRIAYVRKLNAMPTPQVGEPRNRPKPATKEALAKLAAELIATGAFRAAATHPPEGE